jgi:protein-S-isoprenylcysteine O-methyltransferase Ste14
MPTIKDTLFVSGQLGIFIAYILAPAFKTFPQSPVVRTIGFIILAVGLLVLLLSIYQLRKHISPFPSPLKHGSLITTGIYSYVRHPIYSGILITLTGHVLTSPQLGRIIITSLLTVFFYFKSRYEEKLLLNTYPGYHDYKKRTCRFFPGF